MCIICTICVSLSLRRLPDASFISSHHTSHRLMRSPMKLSNAPRLALICYADDMPGKQVHTYSADASSTRRMISIHNIGRVSLIYVFDHEQSRKAIRLVLPRNKLHAKNTEHEVSERSISYDRGQHFSITSFLDVGRSSTL